jgi:hypothetical protein
MKGDRNPVKKNMDKFHKPSTHRDKSKYDRRTESQVMQDELEPIPPVWHPTEHDESDDLEDAKRIEEDRNRMEDEGGSGMDDSGAFESDIEECYDIGTAPPISKDDAERGSW